VDVFFWAHPDGGSVQLIVDDVRKALIPTGAKEPAPGYFALKLDDGPHSVELRPAGDGPVTLFGLALERDTPGVVVDALGINGARAAAQLRWNEKIHASNLARRRPDLVVLAYGTNALTDDEEPLEVYEANLTQVVKRIRDATPQASCLFVGPSDWPEKVTELVRIKRRKSKGRRRRQRYVRRLRGFRPHLRQAPLIAVQKRVAHKHGCGYWDWQAAMGGELSMLHWYRAVPPMARKDLVHLTFRGYQRIGQLLWDALMAGFGDL
jgi:lysophospholipase L1-like esterase